MDVSPPRSADVSELVFTVKVSEELCRDEEEDTEGR